jgi:hypothetical protein
MIRLIRSALQKLGFRQPDALSRAPASPQARSAGAPNDLRELLQKIGIDESEINKILEASTDSQKRLLLDSLAERREKRHGGSSSSPIGGR